ncbi:MAG: VWA domain-containing protein [Candidatus Brocadiia bacterium]|nr:MAG: VWA domain-containing protein [Candidatus Brocadiia bacterium]
MKTPVLIITVFLLGSALSVSANPNQVQFDAAMGHPLLLADKTQTDYLKVGLTGFEMPSEKDRAPVNISIVIDKSGSMSGEKIEKAKEAAIMVIRYLNPRDIISVTAYDSTVKVILPATEVSDIGGIIRKIRHIEAGGSTALYEGVRQGAEEVKKYLSENRVNRIVLLSDGLANVGPDSPDDLGALGRKLIKKGISVTTIGLGENFNEDLMTKLAFNSDGNHYFAENPRDLEKIFDKEFRRALSVVAQEIQIEIRCRDGIRPVRLLGREGTIKDRNVSVFINQLYSKAEKFVILEVEIPPKPAGTTQKVAEIEVSYSNLKTHTTDRFKSEIEVNFSDSKALVEERANNQVMADVIELLAVERNEIAIQFRDKGDIDKARKVFLDNSSFLKSNASRYNSQRLSEYSDQILKESEKLEADQWNMSRKQIRQSQYQRSTQQE